MSSSTWIGTTNDTNENITRLTPIIPDIMTQPYNDDIFTQVLFSVLGQQGHLGTVTRLDGLDLPRPIDDNSTVITTTNLIPQRYEYRYLNDVGVDVVIRGSYNDVMSVVDVLNMYKPLKNNDQKDECKNDVKRNAPEVGVIDKGKYIHINMDNKVFSGSGSLIIIVPSGVNDIKNSYFALLEGNDGVYQEPGGKIDKVNNVVSNSQQSVNRNTLFANSVKETTEETNGLFEIKEESKHYVDVESEINNTFYRVYLYIVHINVNPEELKRYYTMNKTALSSVNNLDSYNETKSLALFKFSDFEATLNSVSNNVSQYSFKNNSGQFKNVKGRTVKAIRKAIEKMNRLGSTGVQQMLKLNRTVQNTTGINKITI